MSSANRPVSTTLTGRFAVQLTTSPCAAANAIAVS